jgi:pyrroline-5-carboxylate reductase
VNWSVIMVGCGNMGGALLSRWVELPDVTVTVVDPGEPQLPAGAHWVKRVEDLPADARFNAMILAVKPQLIDIAIPPAAKVLTDDACVISIAAGTSCATVAKAAGGAAAIRLMPNMPARVGRGVSGLFATSDASDAHKALADQLGQAVGEAIWLADEDQIDRITAAAGSGPGYVFEFARTYQAAAEAQGFSPDDARRLVIETVAGCMALALETGKPFDALRDSIMSKGGTTAAGVAALNADGVLDERLKAALTAAYTRACELRG